MTAAEYCEAMVRWWRDASAGDPPVATRAVRAEAHAMCHEEYAAAWRDAPRIADAPALAWDRAAARLRGAK